MLRFLEFIFGLERGFLSRDGELVLRFDPPWPAAAPPWVWNVVLAMFLLAWVVWVYRRENTTSRKRIVFATLRVALFGLLLAMLNRPMLGSSPADWGSSFTSKMPFASVIRIVLI